MNKLLGNLCAGLLLALLPVPALAAAPVDDADEVHAAVEGSINKILATLTNEELTRRERRETVKEVIESMADLKLLAKLSLGRTHWGNASSEQRKAFTGLFVETIRQSTYEKLELFTDEKVEIGTPEPIASSSKSPKFRVVTAILARGERTELALRLTKRGKSWRVYDLEIEGVSLMKSYQSQYSDFLRAKDKDMDDLLAEMRKRIEEVKARMAALDAKEEPAR